MHWANVSYLERTEMKGLYTSPYKSELIQMYAELMANPVKISYPKGQPSNRPTTDEERWKLKNFKWNNRFETIYTFGSCKIEHYDPEEFYMEVPVTQELRFFTDRKTYDFASLNYYHQTDEIQDNIKRPLMPLYQNVKSKLYGRPFTNPLEKYMQNHMRELWLYAQNALDEEQAKVVLAQLNEIKSALCSQSISK